MFNEIENIAEFENLLIKVTEKLNLLYNYAYISDDISYDRYNKISRARDCILVSNLDLDFGLGSNSNKEE